MTGKRFTGKHAKPVYNAHYALYVVVARHYKRHKRLKRVLIKYVYSKGIRQTHAQHRIVSDKLLYLVVIPLEVEVFYPKGGVVLSAWGDSELTRVECDRDRFVTYDTVYLAVELSPSEGLSALAGGLEIKVLNTVNSQLFFVDFVFHACILPIRGLL